MQMKLCGLSLILVVGASSDVSDANDVSFLQAKVDFHETQANSGFTLCTGMSPPNLHPAGCRTPLIVKYIGDDKQGCLRQCMDAGATICAILVYKGEDQCMGYTSCNHHGLTTDAPQRAEWYVNGAQCPGGGVTQGAAQASTGAWTDYPGENCHAPMQYGAETNIGKMVNSASAEECKAICLSTDSCNCVTIRNSNNDCYMRENCNPLRCAGGNADAFTTSVYVQAPFNLAGYTHVGSDGMCTDNALTNWNEGIEVGQHSRSRQSSVQLCADRCDNTPNCNGFVYWSERGGCRTYGACDIMRNNNHHEYMGSDAFVKDGSR